MVSIIGIDETQYKKITCKSCASILQYAKIEVLTHNGTDYSGGRDGHEYIVCPGCNEKVIIRSW